GSSSGGVAFWTGLLLLFLPFFAFLAVLDRFAPGIMKSHTAASQTYHPIRYISWSRVFRVAMVPLLATAIAVPIVYFITHARLSEKPYSVNLDQVNRAIPKEGTLVEVSGRIARRYLASYRYGDQTYGTDYFYVPFTSSGWTPAQPVQFILLEQV